MNENSIFESLFPRSTNRAANRASGMNNPGGVSAMTELLKAQRAIANAKEAANVQYSNSPIGNSFSGLSALIGAVKQRSAEKEYLSAYEKQQQRALAQQASQQQALAELFDAAGIESSAAFTGMEPSKLGLDKILQDRYKREKLETDNGYQLYDVLSGVASPVLDEQGQRVMPYSADKIKTLETTDGYRSYNPVSGKTLPIVDDAGRILQPVDRSTKVNVNTKDPNNIKIVSDARDSLDKYRKDIDFDKLRGGLQQISGAIESAKNTKNSPGADRTMLAAFGTSIQNLGVLQPSDIKYLSDYGTVQNLQIKINNLMSGEKLTPEGRAEIVRIGHNLYKARADDLRNRENLTKQMVVESGYNPEYVSMPEELYNSPLEKYMSPSPRAKSKVGDLLSERRKATQSRSNK